MQFKQFEQCSNNFQRRQLNLCRWNPDTRGEFYTCRNKLIENNSDNKNETTTKNKQKNKYHAHDLISRSSKTVHGQLHFLIKISLLLTLRNIFLSFTIKTQ